MNRSQPVDSFTIAYHDTGPADAASVVLLHGWPGDSHDYRAVVPLLANRYRVVVPDLRGFGASDRHLVDPDTHYSPSAQARSVAGLIDQLDLGAPVVGGYDVGSRVAQTLATEHPDKVRGLVLSPPLPGIGERWLAPDIVPELWYLYLHRSPLSVRFIDGQRDKVHAYLHYCWGHWSGPDFVVDGPEFERLVDDYARPGAFEASTNWYRVGPGYVARSLAETPPDRASRISRPTHVLWPEHDPLFPRAWSDRLDEFFADVHLHPVDGIGHFTPLEAPAEFARLIDLHGQG
ncbi:alpha/beta hydrolase [Pseudonocardia yunnanensis]|uniref:Alpha/beta fold hydrolase n=1 Tax=Pseudonocardia yunnanensis TaxID=58107 RepID=A0ABW4EQZ5_9PSEU